MRVEKYFNVLINGILFVKCNFFDNIKGYVKGDFYMNSPEEKKLFDL